MGPILPRLQDTHMWGWQCERLGVCEVGSVWGWQCVRLAVWEAGSVWGWQCEAGSMLGCQCLRLVVCEVGSLWGWQFVRLGVCEAGSVWGWHLCITLVGKKHFNLIVFGDFTHFNHQSFQHPSENSISNQGKKKALILAIASVKCNCKIFKYSSPLAYGCCSVKAPVHMPRLITENVRLRDMDLRGVSCGLERS